jgi:hypothetical protein
MMARQLGCGQVPPRLFLHEFLKPGGEIKESLQDRRVFEYQCNPTVYALRPLVPTTIAHPSFTSWWQEFHDHTFNELVHSFRLELMPDFQPISEVINCFFFSQSCSSLLIRIFAIFCRIQRLPLVLGQSPTTLQAQSLPWDSIPPLWLK